MKSITEFFPARHPAFTQTGLVAAVSLFIILLDNRTFFSKFFAVYPLGGKNILYAATLVLLLFYVTSVFLVLLSSRYTAKPILITTLVISSAVAYFTDTYQVMIDRGMIGTVFETDMVEAAGLFSWQLLLYVVLLGVLPSIFVYRCRIVYRGWKKEILSRLVYIIVLTLLVASSMFLGSGFYYSFFRMHRPLKNYTVPYYWIKSSISFAKHSIMQCSSADRNKIIKKLDPAAKVIHKERSRPILMIFVVGEAARWDHFALNGYERHTAPELSSIGDTLINFPKFYSCGTMTAHSVPCMFSRFDRKNFSREKERWTENLMDLLHHAGVDLLWRDNNSDPKGVMDRLGYEDYRDPKNNPVCDSECRDEGMLAGLEDFIDKNPDRDKLIVLHQMGSHGPEYYKRYTQRHAIYKPECKSNQLQSCSREELVNTYDNTILHTDSFLADTIDFLKKYQGRYDTVMLYVADHGESLGENGVYLHGMPYSIAPEAQRHVGAIMWLGRGFKDIDVSGLKKAAKNRSYSHDNIFSTVLGIFDINSSLYRKDMDIISE